LFWPENFIATFLIKLEISVTIIANGFDKRYNEAEIISSQRQNLSQNSVKPLYYFQFLGFEKRFFSFIF